MSFGPPYFVSVLLYVIPAHDKSRKVTQTYKLSDVNTKSGLFPVESRHANQTKVLDILLLFSISLFYTWVNITTCTFKGRKGEREKEYPDCMSDGTVVDIIATV